MSSTRSTSLPLRTRLAVAAGKTAATASKILGRGSGGMIGGKIALRLSPNALKDLAANTDAVIVTGTNGKSTTTRMVRIALATRGQVASNTNGDNLPSGVLAALMKSPGAHAAALEVDEMHVPAVAAKTKPAAIVLLNLSRDQLDRVGEIGSVERRLRQAVDENPQATIVANCDDPLIASAATDAANVVWVAAGAGWGADAVAYPRGGRVLWDGPSWKVVPTDDAVPTDDEAAAHQDEATHAHVQTLASRPQPQWYLEDINLAAPGGGTSATLVGPENNDSASDARYDLRLKLPGRANLGNAAQAVAAAVALGIPADQAVAAVGEVTEVAGRYSVHDIKGRLARIVLAKNPAGWQETMTMVDPEVDQIVIGVNGQVPDGQDLSWLWDVDFGALKRDESAARAGERAARADEAADQRDDAALPDPAQASSIEKRPRRIIACGERGADLAVRLEYAGIHCELVDTPMRALARLKPGRVEMLLNYTALRDFKRILDRAEGASNV